MHRTQWLYTTALCNAALMGGAFEVQANPQGGVVAAGSADIKSINNQKLEIHQHTDKAVIDWRSFDIDQGQHTEFKQPSKTSHTLNRVNSNDPSQILGKLSANGKVTLINPNGVFFGKSAQVDVNGLIATTADIKNADFMAGKHNFTKASNNPDAKIINEGQITAKEAGLVGLVAPHVENHGIIRAKTVQMASGDLALDLHGDGLLHIAASDAIKQQIIKNTGLIVAAETDTSGTVTGGGTIAITAAAARDAVNSLVVIEGELHAPVINQTGGKIIIANASKDIASTRDNKGIATNAVIQAGSIDILNTDKAGKANGMVAVSGIIKAEYPTPLPSPKPQTLSPTTGGTIRISGKTTMVNNAVLDVSGTNGGGDLRLGGEYLGGTTEVPLPGKFVKNLKTPNAETTIVGENTLLIADAHARGDGGNMVTWADGDTYFYGNIFARGGTEYGDGGFVEVSGKGYLDMQANTVDLTPQHSSGKKGTLLLDPTDIVISNFAPNDASIAANLKLWLDASDASTVTLAYDTNGLSSATASGSSGTKVITTSANVGNNLAVGARIRLTAAGATTTANTLGPDTYTIASISCTTTCTINTVENLTNNYTTQTLYRGLVSQWSDKSGLAIPNNATQGAVSARPLWLAGNGGINNNPTISFDGTVGGDILNINYNLSGEQTFFLNATRRQQTNDSGSCCRPIISTNQASNHGKYIHVYRNDRSPNDALVASWYASADADTGSATWALNDTKIIYAYMNDSGSNNVVLGLNGATNITATISANSSGAMSHIGGDAFVSARRFNGNISDVVIFNTNISGNPRNLIEQYQSAKYNIALTAPGTGATEAEKAMAADGYSVFHKGYLERLSQTADIALVADNSITINDLTANGGDGVLALSAGRNLSMTTTTGNITMLNTANTLRTNGGTITASAGGSLTLGNLDTTGNGATATGAAISLTGSSLTLGGNIQTGTSGSLLASSTTGNLTTTAALNGLQGAALFKSNNNLTISGGDITTSTGSNALTFLAQGDITFLSSVQHGGSGNVNVVAGWDGTTEASATPATFNMANILAQPVATTTIYGQDNDGGGANTGSVFVNTASGVQGVSVGSRYGTTTVASNNLTINGANSLGFDARLGYKISNAGNQLANGNIKAYVKNALLLNGGSGQSANVQIGHGNNFCTGGCSGTSGNNMQGNIDLIAASLAMNGGAFRSNIQVGHGGRQVSGHQSGDISISLTNDLDMTPSVGESWLQIGHGGFQASGTHNGNINISGNNIEVIGAPAAGNAYALIGHYNNSTNNSSGNIIISATGELSIVDGASASSFASIGHLGILSNANIHIAAHALDFADDTPGNGFVINDANFASRMAANLQGGDVTIISTNPGGGSSFNWQTPFTATGNTNRLSLISARSFGASQPINTGNGQFFGMSGWNGTSGLNADGSIDLSNIQLNNVGTSSDFNIGVVGSITSAFAGDAIIIASEDNFTNNNSSATTLSTPNGRHLVYSPNPADDTLGGIVRANKRYNINYGDDISAFSGSHFFYSIAPTLTLTADSQTYTYNSTASQFDNTAYTITSAGLIDGDSLAHLTGAATVSATDKINAGIRDITVGLGTLASALGYGFSVDNTPTNELTINKAALTLTANANQSKVYGDAEPASYGYSITSGNLFGSDTFSGALARTAGENAGLYAINQGSLTAGSNYSLSYNSADFEISKALLTLTPTAQNYTYNASNNQFNNTAYTLSGFKFSDTASVVSGSGLVSASDKINAGTRDITASTGTLNASNYSFIANTLNNGLGIAKANLTIDVNDASRQVGQPNPNFTYLVTGLKGNDGESVINNLNVTTPASLNSPAGTYAITAQNAQAQNYSFTYQNGILTLLPVTTPNQPITTAINLPATVEQVSQNIRGSRGSNDLTNNNLNPLNRSNPYNTAANFINKTVFQKGIIPVATDITDIIIDKDTLNNTRLIMHPELAKKLGYTEKFIEY